MPPASYILWIVVAIGGAIASMAVTMGYSIFLIYWVFRIVGALLVTAAAWRIVLSSGATIWPAVIITLICAAWLIGLLGTLRGEWAIMRYMAVVGSVAVIACGIAGWAMQEPLSGDELNPSIYGYALAALGLVMVAASNTLVALPSSVIALAHYVLVGLAVAGCVLIVWSVHRMVRAIGHEYWIVVSVALPVGLFAAVLAGRFVPGMRMGDGAMFVIFPFLALIGGTGFWRLSTLARNLARLRGIEALNAGRLAA